MSGPVARLRPQWGRLRPLVPLAFLVISACTQAAPTQFTGSQPRTALDKIPAGGDMKNFTLVGTNQLVDAKFNIPRGQNGGITAIRDCLYVGSNGGMQPTLVLDMKDMTKPVVIGELPGITGQSMAGEAIEGVADLNLLVNSAQASKVTFPGYTFPVSAADKKIGLMVYDVTDCRKPTVVAKVDVTNANLHYMSLWRDPNKPERVLADVTFSSGVPTDGVDIRVYDLTGCPQSCNPKMVGAWGLRAQLGIPATVVTKYEGGTRTDSTQTHDVTWSLDGRRLHLAQLQYGYMQIDSSALGEGRTCDPTPATSANQPGHCLTVFPSFKPLAGFATEVSHVHGIVSIPGRPYVAVSSEGGDCPYAGILFAYIGDQDVYNSFDKVQQVINPTTAGSVGTYRADLFPRNVGTFAVPEDNPDRCPRPGVPIPDQGANGTGPLSKLQLNERMDVHDALAFPDLLIATWYGGGLRAVDITNPFTPFELGYFFNKPAPDVVWCDNRTGGCANAEVDAEGVPVRQKSLTPPGVNARSYPIAMNGYIVYSDGNSGVYVLKYTGPHADEIPATGLCISHNPSVVKPGFEPCPPYKTWSPAK